MSTHIEAEAVVRRMEGYGEAFAPAIVAYWREHVQPAVKFVPDGCELVCDDDGVPVFRAPTDDDYGWLGREGAVGLMGRARYSRPSDTFGGKRYIIRQVAPPVSAEVERLARALAVDHGTLARMTADGHAYTMVRAQNLYDRGVRCPEQTP